MHSDFDLIRSMHRKFGHSIKHMDANMRREFFWNFRVKFIEEELDELKSSKTPEDIVDALIDIIVVAAGTLDLFNVDVERAFIEVMCANLTKRSGMNPTRENKFGLPDLIKPESFIPPDHTGNTGDFKDVV